MHFTAAVLACTIIIIVVIIRRRRNKTISTAANKARAVQENMELKKDDTIANIHYGLIVHTKENIYDIPDTNAYNTPTYSNLEINHVYDIPVIKITGSAQQPERDKESLGKEPGEIHAEIAACS